MELLPLNDVIRILDLQPLVGEGGLWSQPYSSDETLPAAVIKGREGDHPLASTIYFLLTPTTFSSMHRLTSDEIWYYHMGAPVELLLIYPDGSCTVAVLGCDLLHGERPQLTVPRGTWMGARIRGDQPYGLLSTSMAPAYLQIDFESGSYEQLLPLLTDPALEPMLRHLTQPPRYE
jgi:hypothetical protein